MGPSNSSLAYIGWLLGFGARKLTMPVLAIGAGGGDFTLATMSQVASGPVRSASLPGVGHYAAQEAPKQVAEALLDCIDTVDAT